LGVNVPGSYDSFVARLSSQATSTHAAIIRGFAIGSYFGAPGDGLQTTSDKHFFTMSSKRPACFEVSNGVNHRLSYIKHPGALSLVPAGAAPVILAETEFDLVVSAWDSTLVSALDSEMEHRRNGELRLQVNFQDAAAQQLMRLLVADANEGHTTERLYTDYLSQALAVRMLYLGRQTIPQTNNRNASTLPKHVLRRVIERMRTFSSDLSLQALANDSGYSRVHFVRMFKTATGYSPHNYLLNMKLERVLELLKNPSMSLIDIALESGFSSHSHMSRLFHRVVGVTPSAYRRSLRT
jgi:AraC family transcriptional regulator